MLYFHCNFHFRDQQKRLTEAELELAAAKSKGYVSKYGVSSNGTAAGHRLHAVVGVMTSFGSLSRREAIRKNLMPSGNGVSFADCFFGFSLVSGAFHGCIEALELNGLFNWCLSN